MNLAASDTQQTKAMIDCMYVWHAISNDDNTVPNAPQNLPSVQDSQELVFCGGFVEVGRFFIDKERIWHPNQINVFSTHHELLETFASLK